MRKREFLLLRVSIPRNPSNTTDDKAFFCLKTDIDLPSETSPQRESLSFVFCTVNQTEKTSFSYLRKILNKCQNPHKENFQNACKNHKTSAEKVIFTINSGRIINREITIPYVRSNKVESIIINNASEYFPLDITEYKMVHKINETIVDEKGKYIAVDKICKI